jgi:hypothetical protein
VIASAIPGHQALAGLCPAVRLSDASPQSLAADVRRLPPTSDASFDEARMWLTSNFSVERYADEIMRHYDEILERT